MTTHVWIAQCLCPQRHCILAAADQLEDDDPQADAEGLGATLRNAVAKMMTFGWLNPWCGLCHAGSATWTYEVERTRYATMADARPVFAEVGAIQAWTSAVFGDMDRSRPN